MRAAPELVRPAGVPTRSARTADRVLDDYERWLGRQALADRTRSGYRRWVRELVAHLDSGDELGAFLGVNGDDDRRALLGDRRRQLVDRGLAPSTVNLALAAARNGAAFRL